MDSQVIDRVKTRLQSMETALSGRLVRKRGAGVLASLAGRVDRMNDTAGHEAAVRRLGYETGLLLRIKAALVRIRKGAYGKCLLCHNPISARHISAVPWAAFCIKCRKAVDSREAVLVLAKDNPAF